jgi:hypothetical protein
MHRLLVLLFATMKKALHKHGDISKDELNILTPAELDTLCVVNRFLFLFYIYIFPLGIALAFNHFA